MDGETPADVLQDGQSEREARDLARLSDHLADHAERCPNCGYLLRHLTRPRCPECGVALCLRVGEPRVRLAAWLLLVVPLWMAAAEGLYGVFWFFSDVVVDQDMSSFEPIDFLLQGVLALTIPAAAVATLLRPLFLQLDRAAQWTIAGVIGGGALSLLLVQYLYYTLIIYFI